jgi:pyruvate formate lyase activating enzyme
LAGETFLPADIVKAAQGQDCQSISYTYTEPTIFYEFAFDTARIAKENGLGNSFVTNGYMTSEVLEEIRPYLDAANVDLKAFNETFYRKMCGAHLQPVLDSICTMKDLGIWVEITTLIIPGQNDDSGELKGLVAFIAGIDPDIPWHISRYHPDYKYSDSPATPVETLRKAYQIGKEGGLRYIYIGNVTGESEGTFCPECGQVLIRRSGYYTSKSKIKNSRCESCGALISGVFDLD